MIQQLTNSTMKLILCLLIGLSVSVITIEILMRIHASDFTIGLWTGTLGQAAYNISLKIIKP